MTLKEKYEKNLKDSENFVEGEKENVTNSYYYGKTLARFFNEDLDYSDMNVHYSYPMEKFGKAEEWDVKLKFQLRKPEIMKFAPLDGPFIYEYLTKMADSEWVRGEPSDSEAKEIMRGMKAYMNPLQEDLNIKSVMVEWAIHVPDCTTFYMDFMYAYPTEEELERRWAEENGEEYIPPQKEEEPEPEIEAVPATDSTYSPTSGGATSALAARLTAMRKALNDEKKEQAQKEAKLAEELNQSLTPLGKPEPEAASEPEPAAPAEPAAVPAPEPAAPEASGQKVGSGLAARAEAIRNSENLE